MEETVGGVKTDRFAMLLARPAIDVCVVVTPEVAFGLLPSALLVTLKVTVQLLVVKVPGIVIPMKLFRPLLAVKVFPLAPAHVPAAAPPTALILVSVSVKE